MHKYLRAVGFGHLKGKSELDHILGCLEWDYSSHELVGVETDWDLCEFRRDFGPGIGVALNGYMDMEELFTREYYYPYFYGTGITSYSEITVERRIEKEDYVGICEDPKVDISLIFKLQNSIEYIRERQKGKKTIKYTSVTLSGLCNEGTILLPIMKSEKQKKKQGEDTKNRMTLLHEARGGDVQAMESLTLDDIDIYAKVSRRLITEDILSIVDTYIMPYGVECDVYSIMGEIRDLRLVENEKSHEKIYIMSLDVNNLNFDICVPEKSVTGKPEVGRRFKGNIWLQGHIHFR
ncbi:hypothetical protein M2150_001894 [Lachnospiraceae bacterium PM6-15]|uniref:DUF3881 family protein n=1 Tax=Ohessyouella blattaphilus TaxID=2949333 RepID=UPI003E2536A6